MIKKLLIGVAGLVVALAVIGLLLPRMSHIERSITIDRPAALVYATVNSFRLFPQWSPWQDLDPNMKQSVSGPPDGVGAKLVWTGNDKVGSGTQIITASTPDKSVESDVDFGGMGTAKSTFTLTDNGASTQVKWSLDSDMGKGPVGHYFGLMMDSMVGKDYERGLAKLKALIEAMPRGDGAGVGDQHAPN
jgi:uncharacterized membrane protein